MAGNNALAKLYSWADGVKRRARNPMQTLALGLTQANEDLQQAATDADIAYGRNGMKSVLLSQQQRDEAAKRAAQFGEQMAMAAATVYHGSPHKFNKFDSSKIGTGEGAQAYGHGLYLAETPEVARTYRSAGADPSTFVPVRSIRDPAQMASTALERAGGDMRHAMAVLTQNMQSGDITAGAALQLLKKRAALPESKYAGNMYKVDLPDNAIAKMLDWDKPLSQQPQAIQDAVKPLLTDAFDVRGYKGGWGSLEPDADAVRDVFTKTGHSLGTFSAQDAAALNFPGSAIVKALGNMDTESAATAQLLRKQGLTGIRYLDGGSRGAGAGTSNYVVFPGNENLLRILERNGMAP